ncbi:MAG: hypothetical protein VX085_14695, partial [Pseudomonadota bacterium]|nr:hypothetical protein [Pseudomonadota bacterium]
TRRQAWRDGKPPAGREMHPVVLVSHAVAAAYVRWLSKESSVTFPFPREAELERGVARNRGVSVFLGVIHTSRSV